MAQLFLPEHYETARQYGIPNFSMEETQVMGELNLTLSALRAVGIERYSRDDLVGYHFLHYGANAKATEAAIDSVVEFETKEWNQWLQEIVLTALNEEGLPHPIPLGRIALGRNTVLLTGLQQLSGLKRIGIRGGPENGYEGAQRFGEFLYPEEQTVLSYLGRHSLDIMTESPPYETYILEHDSGAVPQPLERLAVHADIFTVEKPDAFARYVALSYDQDEQSYLTRINFSDGYSRI